MIFRQFGLYFLVLLLITFVLVCALGGGLFNQPDHWLLQWQHQLFSGVCHQDPNRSYWLGAQPMAVCSRCLGIYSSFWVGWLMLPLFAHIKGITADRVKLILAVLVVLNILDVLGNLLGTWQNSLFSRLILGALTGGMGALLFSSEFFITKHQQCNRDQYAAITTTDHGK